MQLSLGFTQNIQSYVLASEGGYVNAPFQRYRQHCCATIIIRIA